MAYDLGDVATLAITVKDSAGVAADATAVVATVTAPDGSTSTPSVVHGTTGNYSVAFTATLVGRHSIRWVASGTNAGASTDVFDILDPALLPIVSLSDLKAHLRDTATAVAATDDLYRYTLAQATELAERYTGRALRRKTVVETHDGDVCALILRQPPVVSVTTVVENGTTLAATDYTLNAASGLLYRGPSTYRMEWADVTQGVVVTYVAGYTDPPLVAQRAVLDISRWLWKAVNNGSPRPAFGQPDNADMIGTDAVPNWLYRPLDALVLPGVA